MIFTEGTTANWCLDNFTPYGARNDIVVAGLTAENTLVTVHEHAESERPATQARLTAHIGSKLAGTRSRAPIGTPPTFPMSQ